MGLGLPLLQTLTVDQLRAVLAHEFGHYYGGDTMLGTWIQKTRMGILRTVQSLGESWIRLPFTFYAKLFFRITNAVSRHQEFAADALAARVVGPQALADGLKQIHRAGSAFGPFWQNEYVPALRYRVRPPLGAGFSRFMLQDQVAAGVESVLQQELSTAKADPYDSHPPLLERCAALARLEHREGVDDKRVSITLLHELPELERELLGIAVLPELKDARAVGWNEVPELVWYPTWRNEITRQAGALQGAAVADAASLCLEPQAIARKLVVHPGFLPTMDQRCREARHIIGVALAVALIRAGWRLEGSVGEPIVCIREAEVLEPFALVAKFESGELSPQAWREQCDRLGISALPLALAPSQGV